MNRMTEEGRKQLEELIAQVMKDARLEVLQLELLF